MPAGLFLGVFTGIRLSVATPDEVRQHPFPLTSGYMIDHWRLPGSRSSFQTGEASHG
jgi:hypothetical protein